VISAAYIEFIPFDIFQIYGDGVLSGIALIDIADPMGSKIDLAILLVVQFILPTGKH
jgi:hypothetical protein